MFSCAVLLLPPLLIHLLLPLLLLLLRRVRVLTLLTHAVSSTTPVTITAPLVERVPNFVYRKQKVNIKQSRCLLALGCAVRTDHMITYAA